MLFPTVNDWPDEAEEDRRLWRILTSWDAPLRFSNSRVYSQFTLVTRERLWGHYLTWLNKRGWLHRVERPAERMNYARLTHYLEDELVRPTSSGRPQADYTLYMRVRGLWRVVSLFHPEGNYKWMLRHPLRPRGPFHLRGRARLPWVGGDDLVRLALEKISQLSDGPRGGKQAIQYRNLLAIAFLSAAPIRLNNFIHLQIGTHLVQQVGSWILQIPSRQTKAGVAVGLNIPAWLEPGLSYYVSYVRPALLRDCFTDRLWVKRDGVLSRIGMTQGIYHETSLLLGQGLRTHAFRHIAARDILTSSPTDREFARAVLGHRGAESLWWYDHGTEQAALERWHRRLFSGE